MLCRRIISALTATVAYRFAFFKSFYRFFIIFLQISHVFSKTDTQNNIITQNLVKDCKNKENFYHFRAAVRRAHHKITKFGLRQGHKQPLRRVIATLEISKIYVILTG